MKFKKTLIVPFLLGSSFLLHAQIEEAQAAGPNDEVTHIVQKGESVPKIAARYNVPIGTLRKLNNIQNDFLAVNQKLVVKQTTNSNYYTVLKGDTVAAISKKTGVPIKSIRINNQLKNDFLVIGQNIQLKHTEAIHSSPSVTKYPYDFYIVKKGDTVPTVSLKTGIPIKELRAWNHIQNDALFIGQTLMLKEVSGVSHIGKETYTVKKGDTIQKISFLTGISIQKLRTWNMIQNDALHVSQILKLTDSIPVTEASSPSPEKEKVPSEQKQEEVAKKEPANSEIGKEVSSDSPTSSDKKEEPKQEPSPKTHIVQKGDTLSKIATTYQLTVSDLKAWNNLSNDLITIGQTLTLIKPKETVKENPPSSPTSEKPKETVVQPSIFKLSTHTAYGTTIHVLEFDKSYKLTVSKGINGKLERLSNMSVPNEVAKVNLGIFGPNYEHSGLYFTDNKLYQDSHSRHLTLLNNKSNLLEIKQFGDSISKSELSYLQKQAQFAVGTTYGLIQDGRKLLTNTSLFSHAGEKNPRTLFGQKKDGTFIIAVTDGRGTGSSGLTANQSAEVMLSLGAYQAVNFDGGGSSELIVGNKIINKLQNGEEREIGSALFISK